MIYNSYMKKPKNIIKKLTLIQELEFWSYVKSKPSNEDCWEWNGVISSNGYGQFSLNGKYIAAHRIAYKLSNKKINRILTVDHICRNRKCVRPTHLREISEKQNVLIGNGQSAINSRKTHCIRGHELKGKNLGTQWKGINRKCIPCSKLTHKMIYQRRKKDPVFIKDRIEYQKKYRSNPIKWKAHLEWQRKYRLNKKGK